MSHDTKQDIKSCDRTSGFEPIEPLLNHVYVADVGLCTNDNTRTSRSDSFITLFRIVTSDQHNKAFSFKLWNIKLNNNINIYT